MRPVGSTNAGTCAAPGVALSISRPSVMRMLRMAPLLPLAALIEPEYVPQQVVAEHPVRGGKRIGVRNRPVLQVRKGIVAGEQQDEVGPLGSIEVGLEIEALLEAPVRHEELAFEDL